MLNRTAPFAFVGFLAIAGQALADVPSVPLSIQNRQFTPQEITVPANTKVELVVSNQDSLPAEFESYDLSREVVVPGKSTVKVYIGPLDPGRYNFFNDFNHAAQGWVVVSTPETAAK